MSELGSRDSDDFDSDEEESSSSEDDDEDSKPEEDEEDGVATVTVFFCLLSDFYVFSELFTALVGLFRVCPRSDSCDDS